MSAPDVATPTTRPVVVTVVYFSSYRGATRELANAVVAGAASVPGVEASSVAVQDVDLRWPVLHASDALIFGSPTYVGGVAARFKEFIESCAGDIWTRRLWLNKLAGGFTVSAGRSGDKFNCLLDLVVFATQMGMIWVPVPITGGNYSSTGSESDLNRMAGYLGVMAQANIDEPADQAPPRSDLDTASLYGEHVAWNAARMARGGRDITGGLQPGVPPAGPPATLFDTLPEAIAGTLIPDDQSYVAGGAIGPPG